MQIKKGEVHFANKERTDLSANVAGYWMTIHLEAHVSAYIFEQRIFAFDFDYFFQGLSFFKTGNRLSPLYPYPSPTKGSSLYCPIY